MKERQYANRKTPDTYLMGRCREFTNRAMKSPQYEDCRASIHRSLVNLVDGSQAWHHGRNHQRKRRFLQNILAKKYNFELLFADFSTKLPQLQIFVLSLYRF